MPEKLQIKSDSIKTILLVVIGIILLFALDILIQNSHIGRSPLITLINSGQQGFPSGSNLNTVLIDGNLGLGIQSGTNYFSTGEFTSQVNNVGLNSQWQTLNWTQGGHYQEDLPDNRVVESDADMTGNVLLFHLDESSGTLADSSGQANNGTSSGATYSQSGKFNKALSFNGSSNFVSVANSTSLNPTNAITLEAWFNPSAVGWKYKRLISFSSATTKANEVVKTELTTSNFDYSKAQTSGQDIRFFDSNGNKLRYMNQTWNSTGTSTIWIEVSTIGTNQVYMYYGNSSVASESVSLNIEGTTTYELVETFNSDKPVFPLTDGSQYTNWTVERGNFLVETQVLKNYLGENPDASKPDVITMNNYTSAPGKSLRAKVYQEPYDWRYNSLYIGFQNVDNLYRATFTQTNDFLQIVQLVNGVADVVADVNKVTVPGGIDGNIWYDLEFRWLSNSLVEAELFNSSGTSLAVVRKTVSPGWTSGKFGLDGVRGNSRAYFDDIRIGSLGSTSTITSTVGQETVTSISKAGAYGVGVNDSKAFGSINGLIVSGGNVGNNSWNHVALTYNKSTLKLFLNGVEVATAALTSDIASSNDKLLIGDLIGFNGLIDEVAVYNRALSASEILNHYRRGVLELKLQVRSCSDVICSNASFIGSDGTQNTFFYKKDTPINLTSISSISKTQFFQFKAFFSTQDVNSLKKTTPLLIEVNIDYSATNTAPVINVSKIDNNPDTSSLPTFSFNANGNLTIELEVFDAENNSLTADLNYSSSKTQGTGKTIVSNKALDSSVCAGQDFNKVTICNIDFDISSNNVSDGTYYILLKISDGTIASFDSSFNSFTIKNAGQTTSITPPQERPTDNKSVPPSSKDSDINKSKKENEPLPGTKKDENKETPIENKTSKEGTVIVINEFQEITPEKEKIESNELKGFIAEKEKTGMERLLSNKIKISRKIVGTINKDASGKLDVNYLEFVITVTNVSEEDLNNIFIVELIPKEITLNKENISFKEQPEIQKKENILVQWKLLELKKGEEAKFSYSLFDIGDKTLLEDANNLLAKSVAPVIFNETIESVSIKPCGYPLISFLGENCLKKLLGIITVIADLS